MKTIDPKVSRQTVTLDKETWKAVRIEALQNHRTVQGQLEVIIEFYFSHPQKPEMPKGQQVQK